MPRRGSHGVDGGGQGRGRRLRPPDIRGIGSQVHRLEEGLEADGDVGDRILGDGKKALEGLQEISWALTGTSRHQGKPGLLLVARGLIDVLECGRCNPAYRAVAAEGDFGLLEAALPLCFRERAGRPRERERARGGGEALPEV